MKVIKSLEFLLSLTIVNGNGDILGNYIHVQLPFHLTKVSVSTALFARSFNIYLLSATMYFFLSRLNLPPFNFIKVPIFLCYETGRRDAPDLPLLYSLLFCIFLLHSRIHLFFFSLPMFSIYEFLHYSIHCIPEDEKWNSSKILKSDKMAEACKKIYNDKLLCLVFWKKKKNNRNTSVRLRTENISNKVWSVRQKLQ